MNISSKQYIRYTVSYLLAFLMVLALVATFNYAVDPYGLFDTPRIDKFNRLKPKATSRVRVSKVYQVDRFKPKTIVAGNSRPEIGLDPTSSCWPENFKPVYNTSLPGASVYMASRYIGHAVSGNEVKQVFWGLDFLDFLNDEFDTVKQTSWPPKVELFEERLRISLDGTKNDEYFVTRIREYLVSLFSLNTFMDSIYTVFKQSSNNSPTIRRDGFNPANSFRAKMALEGQGFIL